MSGVFPEPLKTAVIKPLLKKDNLDKTQMNNYRPISNLPFLSNLTAIKGIDVLFI